MKINSPPNNEKKDNTRIILQQNRFDTNEDDSLSGRIRLISTLKIRCIFNFSPATIISDKRTILFRAICKYYALDY